MIIVKEVNASNKGRLVMMVMVVMVTIELIIMLLKVGLVRVIA